MRHNVRRWIGVVDLRSRRSAPLRSRWGRYPCLLHSLPYPTGEYVTDWLEFHDSILTGFDARDTGVELLLDAYIHRWERRDDRWRGTGWMQGVRIVVSNSVSPSALPMLPVDISDGWLRLGAVAHNDRVRLPLQASDGVRQNRDYLKRLNCDFVCDRF